MQEDVEEKCFEEKEKHNEEFRNFISEEFPLAVAAHSLEMQYKKVCALLTYVVAKHGEGRIEIRQEDMKSVSHIKSLHISHPEDGETVVLEIITECH